MFGRNDRSALVGKQYGTLPRSGVLNLDREIPQIWGKNPDRGQKTVQFPPNGEFILDLGQ